MEKTVEQIAQEINEKLASAASKSDFDALKAEVTALKDTETISKGDFDKLDKDIQEMAEKLNKLGTAKTAVKGVATFEISKNIKKEGTSPADYDASGVIKADQIHNLFVIDGGEFDEDEANADAAILTLTAQPVRLSERQSSSQEFINTISQLAEPVLMGQAIQAAVVYDETGDAEIVGEGNDKPIVAQKPKVEKVEASVVALAWYETVQYINRMGIFRTFINRNVMARFMDKLANLVMSSINGVATGWTLPTGFNLVPSPNNYDALTALAVYIESFKYSPTHVIINVVDMGNMFTNKGLDGHYTLANGGSIQLIDGGSTLIINGSAIRVIKVDSNIQAVGTVTMFDVSKLRFGLSPQLRTMVNPYEYWRQNIVGNLLEGAYAVLLPSNHTNAVVSATFASIIEDITAPEPEQGGGGSGGGGN
jgi:hypothetical protein